MVTSKGRRGPDTRLKRMHKTLLLKPIFWYLSQQIMIYLENFTGAQQNFGAPQSSDSTSFESHRVLSISSNQVMY